jgi:DNA adenine methylase
MSLSLLEKEYKSLSNNAKKPYYYKIRKEYNSITDINQKNRDIKIKKAAYLIFLNKTCFNGLYRVNSEGKFNVPMGKYDNPTICDKENIMAMSEKLKSVEMICGQYTSWKDKIDEHTFIFLDPPYRPLNNTSSFNAYDKNSFGDQEQKDLAEFVENINAAGAKFVLTNSDPHNTDPTDNFFDDLYSNFDIYRIPATRSINSKGAARGKIKELLITNCKEN